MGYCIELMESKFFIAKKDIPKALQAIKDLANNVDRAGGGGSSSGERWYSWVDTDKFANAPTIVEAMQEWRYPVDLNTNGDVNYISFDGEKLGQEEVVFNAIAPYVKSGSYLQMSGEDGGIWRWTFKNGKVNEENAELKFGKRDEEISENMETE